MDETETKIVVFTIVATVPADFFPETTVYGLDTRAGWVDDIYDSSATEIRLPGLT